MREEIKHAAIAVKHSVAHSPAAGWFAVFITYMQTVWLEWGSVVAEMVSWTIGTLLSLVLLINHSITLYKSIKQNRRAGDEDNIDNQDKQG